MPHECGTVGGWGCGRSGVVAVPLQVRSGVDLKACGVCSCWDCFNIRIVSDLCTW